MRKWCALCVSRNGKGSLDVVLLFFGCGDFPVMNLRMEVGGSCGKGGSRDIVVQSVRTVLVGKEASGVVETVSI